MKATKIYYEKCFNLGNFENEKIGIELIVEDGELAKDVLAKAKQFVNNLNPNDIKKKEYEKAISIIGNKRMHSWAEVNLAEEVVANYKVEEEDNLPF